MKMGFGPAEDERIVSAVRDAVGDDIAVAIDANCAYDPTTAIDNKKQTIPYDLL